jgi:hypothetical protein
VKITGCTCSAEITMIKSDVILLWGQNGAKCLKFVGEG